MTKSDYKRLNNPHVFRAALVQHANLQDNLTIVNLSRFWARQAMDIQQSDIEAAIAIGRITPDLEQQWAADWLSFVSSQLDSVWASALLEGSNQMQSQLRKDEGGFLERLVSRFRQWREARTARLSERLAKTQRQATSDIIRSLGVDRGVSARDTRQIVRASLGLTTRQTAALVKIWDTFAEENIQDLETSKRRLLNNADRLGTIRARRIARTEIAMAFNAGAHEQVSLFIEDRSLMESQVVKVWVTAGDAMVCDFCKSLAAADPLPFAEKFETKKWADGNTVSPPVHPSCRCVIEYRDVS